MRLSGLRTGTLLPYLIAVVAMLATAAIAAAERIDVSLVELEGDGLLFDVPETPSQVLWIGIIDADWQTPQKWQLLELVGPTVKVSDDVTLFNLGGGNIVFRSDDELGNLPPFPEGIPAASLDVPSAVPAFEPLDERVLETMGGKPSIVITVSSDLQSSPGTLSDRLQIRIVPEPTTMLLLGSALAGLAASRRWGRSHTRGAYGCLQVVVADRRVRPRVCGT